MSRLACTPGHPNYRIHMTFDNIPTDPVILLGVINTKLRDFYSSLDALCEDMNLDQNEIKAKLGAIGYIYNPTLNKFV